MNYVAALDQGTTSSRCIVYDETLRHIASSQIEFRQIYPQPGWVEHDPFDILNTQIQTLKDAVARAGIAPRDLAAIGIANQRETALVWDRQTGKPISNAIVWQCRRTAEYCEQLKHDGLEREIASRTGLVVDAYFSGTKVRWLLNNIPGARAAATAGNLLFGTVDSWLIWNLTRERNHLTDATNASRTMLCNIHNCDWDSEMLRMLDIPAQMLPRILPCTAAYGHLSKDILGVEVPICGVAGDQQAALFGQACFQPGSAKNTYGTGCFLLLNTGSAPVASGNRLLTTVAWKTGAETTYALEGSVFMGGATVQWLRDELGLVRSSAETEEIARSVPDSGGVYLVPAFTGLGAPWWDMYARGAILGMTRGTNRAHIVRAALEAIAFQSADVIRAMEADSGIPLRQLKVDGGASANGFLMQIQADLLGCPVVRPESAETTALGAASFAALQTGLFSGTEALASAWRAGAEFSPAQPAEQMDLMLRGWHKAVERAQNWNL